MSVPLGKLGYHLPRTLSEAIDTRILDAPSNAGQPSSIENSSIENSSLHRRISAQDSSNRPGTPVFRIHVPQRVASD